MLLPATVDLYFIRLMLHVINLWLVCYFRSTFITRWRCNHLIRVISEPSSFFGVLFFSFLIQVPSLPIVVLRLTCSSLPLRVNVLRFTLFFTSRCLLVAKEMIGIGGIWTADPWSDKLLCWPLDHATPLLCSDIWRFYRCTFSFLHGKGKYHIYPSF